MRTQLPTIVFAAVLHLAAVANAQILPLPPLSGTSSSGASRLSADGGTVSGISSISSPFRLTPTRWAHPPGGPATALGTPSEFAYAEINGISATGTVAVGGVGPAHVQHAVRWDDTAMTTLPEPAGSIVATATDTSLDGQVTCGWSQDAQGYSALRWDGTTMTVLAPGAFAYAVAPDGTFITGVSYSPGAQSNLIRWHQGGGMQVLAQLPPSSVPVRLADISPDGAAAVGTWVANSRVQSFIWTATYGLTELGSLPGTTNTTVNAISSDGTMAAGRADLTAFVWTRDGGIQEFSAFLESRGIVLGGWIFEGVSDIGDDGRTFVGAGIDPATGIRSGFIVTLATCYANCDGSTIQPILNIDDFTCYINEFAIAQALPHEEQIPHYANCDHSITAPVLNVDDFTCFINAFATGCP